MDLKPYVVNGKLTKAGLQLYESKDASSDWDLLLDTSKSLITSLYERSKEYPVDLAVGEQLDLLAKFQAGFLTPLELTTESEHIWKTAQFNQIGKVSADSK